MEKVWIFIKPKESPQFAIDPKNLRIAFGGYWIDFQEYGEIQIRDENGDLVVQQPI